MPEPELPVRMVPTPAVPDRDRAEDDLRMRLVAAQHRLRDVGGRLVLDLSGDDRPACHDALNRVVEWLDPRHVHTHVLGAPRGDETLYPPFWRYATRMPKRGTIAVFSRAWTMRAVMKRVLDGWSKDQFARRLDAIVRFERAYVDDGVELLKVWFHAPTDEVRAKRRAANRRRRPWRLDEVDEAIADELRAFAKAARRAIEMTTLARAPWHVIETDDVDDAALAFGEVLLEGLTRAADQAEHPPEDGASTLPAPLPHDTPSLADTDLDARLERDTYREELAELQGDLYHVFEKASRKGLRTVLAFEGWDAAGKGGAIRRLVRAVDPRDIDVVRIAAPTDRELAHQHLWRFWRTLPRAGQAVVFDRTWYGRVLVERIEGYATEAEWHRAYDEILGFEEHLTAHGTVVLKFWLHISDAEQLARFRAREETPHKRYKITDDDWRNREKRPAYEQAVDDMLARTHTPDAPWIVVPANDKRFARVAVLKAIRDAMKKAL